MNLVFAYHPYFKSDLADAITAFDSFKETEDEDKFSWELKRWAYTPYSVGKMYRRTLLIERDESASVVVEWDSLEHLESLISELIYEEENV